MMSRGPAGRGPVRWIAAVAAVLLLAGCAAPTPYQPADGGFGYAEQQLESNRYRVVFAGNADTPRSTVENYLLYRAAEVTVQSGHDYFRVVDQNIERSTRYHGTFHPTFGLHHGHPFVHRHGFHHFGTAGVHAQPIDRYTAFADILTFQGEKPADDVSAYDAHDVLRRLEPVIERAQG